LAQAPVGLYRAGISLGFAPDLSTRKPFCTTGTLSSTAMKWPAAGWAFEPAPSLPAPWVVLHGLDDQVSAATAARKFVDRIPEASFVPLPDVGHGFSVEPKWLPQLQTAVMRFASDDQPAPIAPSSTAQGRDPDDLPLTPVISPTAPHTDEMAVMLSGDGGWAGLDRSIAAGLANRGVPVVGINSLRYFWSEVPPQQAARDLERLIDTYQTRWNRRRVVLIGYSFGADVLPFIVNALDQTTRDEVSKVVLLGLAPTADFQFHLTSWLDIPSSTSNRPTPPAVAAIVGPKVQCIQGASEDDSACPTVASPHVTHTILPGGHHFNGDSKAIVNAILSGVAT